MNTCTSIWLWMYIFHALIEHDRVHDNHHAVWQIKQWYGGLQQRLQGLLHRWTFFCRLVKPLCWHSSHWIWWSPMFQQGTKNLLGGLACAANDKMYQKKCKQDDACMHCMHCMHVLHQKWNLFESLFLWFKKNENGKKSFSHNGVVHKLQCLASILCKVMNPVWTVWVGFWWILFCSCFCYFRVYINNHANKFTYYQVHWTC